MDRRKFLQIAGIGTASPLVSWSALAQAKSDRVLIVAEMNANSLDTHTVGANRATYGLVWMIYDRLITFGTRTLPNGVQSYDYFNLKPQLAESWEFAPDNSSVTFKLKRDVTFHDGAPMTAQDVKWSFDRFVKVGGFPQRQMEQGSLTDVDQFEVVDDYTFRVKLLRPDKLTMPSLAIVVPSVYNSELCKKNATASDPWALEWTKINSAGSGAYKVESFKSGEQVVLSRFDGWKGGTPPKFERVMYRAVAAAGTRRALVERGDADLSPDLPPRDVADIIAAKKFKVESAPMANTLKYLALSTITKPFDDVRVRQAIAYAIPYQKVIDSCGVRTRQADVRGARDRPNDASWPQPFPYNHDPDKAKALLRRRDWPPASRPSCSSTHRSQPSTSRPRSSSRTRSASSAFRSRSRSFRTSPRAATRRTGRWRSTCSAPGSTIRISSSAGSGTGRIRSGTSPATRTRRWTSCSTPRARSARAAPMRPWSSSSSSSP